MATIDDRYGSCAAVIGDRDNVVPTDLEIDLGTRRTAQSLSRIISLYPEQHFVWLMGADNLIQIAHWSAWEEIFYTVPIAVFARPTYAAKALSSKAARDFSANRIEAARARELATMPPPAWVYLDIEQHPASASAIRATQRN